MRRELKTLANLMQVSANAVEEKRKEIAIVLQAIELRENHIAQLHQKMHEEAAAAGGDPQLLAAYDAFSRRAEMELQLMQHQLAELQQREAVKRDELAELFAEKKRYEILHQRKTDEIAKEVAKKEQQELDEVAAQRHARQQH